MPWTFDCVLLARHGETEWNRERRRQGQLDSPLTSDGLGHAERVAGLLSGRNVDHIFSSPLGRARNTAEIVATKLHRTAEVLDDLAEVDHGEMAGLTNDEIETRYPGALRQRELQKYTWAFPGGESYADADARAASALNHIARTGARTPLLIAHEMIGRMVLRNLAGSTAAEALSLSLPHGVVIEASTRDGQVDFLQLGTTKK